MGHDQELRLVTELIDEAEEALQVDVVERGLDLVHHVERRRARAKDGEEKGQCRHRSFPAGQQREASDVAAQRSHFDLHPGVEWIVGHGQDETALSAGKEHGDERREVLVDVSHRARERLHDLLVEGADHFLDLATRVAHVAHLGVEVLVALLERRQFIQGQRIDGTERGDARFQFRDAYFEGHAFGQYRVRHLAEVGRLDPEVVSDEFIEVGDLHHQLGLFDLAATHGLAQLGEFRFSLFALASDRFEPFGPGARGLQLFAVGRIHRLLRRTNLFGAAFDEPGEPFEDLEIELQRFAPAGRFGAFTRTTFQPLFDLAPALLQKSAPLGEFGLATRKRGGLLVHSLAQRLESSARFGDARFSLARDGDRLFERGQLFS